MIRFVRWTTHCFSIDNNSDMELSSKFIRRIIYAKKLKNVFAKTQKDSSNRNGIVLIWLVYGLLSKSESLFKINSTILLGKQQWIWDQVM